MDSASAGASVPEHTHTHHAHAHAHARCQWPVLTPRGAPPSHPAGSSLPSSASSCPSPSSSASSLASSSSSSSPRHNSRRCVLHVLTRSAGRLGTRVRCWCERCACERLDKRWPPERRGTRVCELPPLPSPAQHALPRHLPPLDPLPAGRARRASVRSAMSSGSRRRPARTARRRARRRATRRSSWEGRRRRRSLGHARGAGSPGSGGVPAGW